MGRGFWTVGDQKSQVGDYNDSSCIFLPRVDVFVMDKFASGDDKQSFTSEVL